MNTSTTEVMLAGISKDIRRMLADLGLLCGGCDEKFDETIDRSMSLLSRADDEVQYALYRKKHNKETRTQ